MKRLQWENQVLDNHLDIRSLKDKSHFDLKPIENRKTKCY